MSRAQGLLFEAQARDYLLDQGLTWIESNYHCRFGEIDLIMKEKQMVIFVEVRARTSHTFGKALESITYRKRQRLIKTAWFYILNKRLNHHHPIRFDVVSLQGIPPRIDWIKNAFEADF